MIDMQSVNGGVCAAKGFRAAGMHCGIRRNRSKKDLMLIVSDARCAAAACYTQNKVYGAPITVTRQNIADGYAQAIICNSGNANTCNADGVEKANLACALAAQATGLRPDDFIIASTGVIGQPINMEPIAKGLAALPSMLSYAGGADAADAILTTDITRKEAAYTGVVAGKTVTVGGIAKGSGMIHPNMATVLSFVTTDVAISPAMLHCALLDAVKDTYNMVSIDGDTSTNDMLSVMANGFAGNAEIAGPGEAYDAFTSLLRAVLTDLARMVAADGEGATKLIICNVVHAPTDTIARAIAKSVICSSLVKSAIFGADANWGRILCAVGYTEGDFRVDTVDIDIASAAGVVHVCENGAGVPFSEEEAKRVLLADEVALNIDMQQGEAAATAWGCDLTPEYVRINGSYRTR